MEAFGSDVSPHAAPGCADRCRGGHGHGAAGGCRVERSPAGAGRRAGANPFDRSAVAGATVAAARPGIDAVRGPSAGFACLLRGRRIPGMELIALPAGRWAVAAGRRDGRFLRGYRRRSSRRSHHPRHLAADAGALVEGGGAAAGADPAGRTSPGNQRVHRRPAGFCEGPAGSFAPGCCAGGYAPRTLGQPGAPGAGDGHAGSRITEMRR